MCFEAETVFFAINKISFFNLYGLLHVKHIWKQSLFCLQGTKPYCLNFYILIFGNCLFYALVYYVEISIMLFAAIGGPTGELLEQNAQALNQISANLQALQVRKNLHQMFIDFTLAFILV